MENNTRLTKSQVKALSFEEAYERLNETTGKLERSSLSLEDSLALYEEGVLLSQHCDKLLNKAELRVSQISPASFGLSAATEPDDDEDDDSQYEDDEDDDADDSEDITLEDLESLKF